MLFSLPCWHQVLVTCVHSEATCPGDTPLKVTRASPWQILLQETTKNGTNLLETLKPPFAQPWQSLCDLTELGLLQRLGNFEGSLLTFTIRGIQVLSQESHLPLFPLNTVLATEWEKTIKAQPVH